MTPTTRSPHIVLVAAHCPVSTQTTMPAQPGHPMIAEVAALTDVAWVDLPTGHWPMWSLPQALAQVIAGGARRSD